MIGHTELLHRKNMSKYDPHLHSNPQPATTIKGVENNKVFTALDRKTGEMKYFRKGKELPLEDGFALSLGKDKPFDKSGIGVFSGFGEGKLNKKNKEA
jgi:hypothetical protein